MSFCHLFKKSLQGGYRFNMFTTCNGGWKIWMQWALWGYLLSIFLSGLYYKQHRWKLWAFFWSLLLVLWRNNYWKVETVLQSWPWFHSCGWMHRAGNCTGLQSVHLHPPLLLVPYWGPLQVLSTPTWVSTLFPAPPILSPGMGLLGINIIML